MRAGIALGSNIEPRLQNLQAARLRILDLHSGHNPVLDSRVYETSPVDCAPGTAAFLNAAIEVDWDRSPEELHQALQVIETDLGRPLIHGKNSPRTIDLDLLYCGNHVVKSPTLTLPHPGIFLRQFVLRPLADIQPNLVLPNSSQKIAESLTNLCNSEKLEIYSNSIPL
jgi:2-amino-4-hydroxy-6-hydroxymethyldihydropteridine diphosphokinase